MAAVSWFAHIPPLTECEAALLSAVQSWIALSALFVTAPIIRARTTAAHRARRRIPQLLLVMSVVPTILAERAAAQETVGEELCGTPIADFINSTVPLIVALVIIVGTVFALLMHVRAGLARDAEQARFYFDWRNRAAYTSVTAPLLAFLLQMLLGFTGTGIADCINLVPFF